MPTMIAFATSNVARSGIAFVTSLVVARGAGVDGFGLWTLSLAWAGILTAAFDLGFGVLLTRDAARQEPALGRLVGAALTLRLSVLLPAAAMFIAIAPWLAPTRPGANALRLAAAVAAGGVAYSSLASVFQARPRPLVAVLSIETCSAAAQCGAAWWLTRRGYGVVALLGMAAAAQAVQVGAVAVMWRFAAWLPPIERPAPGDLVATLRAAVPFAAAGAIANAQLRVAPLLLGVLSDGAALAAFGVASRFGNLVRVLPQSAFAGALPALSRGTPSDVNGLRSRLDAGLRWFAIASALIIAMAAAPLVRVTYGAAFAGAAPALIWIAAGLVPTIVNGGRKVVLYATGRESSAVRWSAVALALQAAGCIVLVPQFGAAGAAAALALGEAAVWVPLHRRVEALERPRGPVGVVRESPLAG
jgi:O-antigen/teichoic acid export membrane protein